MKKKTFLAIGTAIVVLGVSGWFFRSSGSITGPLLKTAAVTRGTVRKAVTATGTLEPVVSVEVGTQVSGIVDKIYADFNDGVKKGQLLAVLETRILRENVEQAEIAVRSAGSELSYRESAFTRKQALHGQGLLSDEELEEARYGYASAQASCDRARLELQQAKTNLGYAYIYSPINGRVLSRDVNEGQTVSASLNAPTLFVLAADLTGMQVEASVDEADIGRIIQGQRVEFTVDAYPDDEFSGTVSQVRLQPVTTQNVVTYTVIVEAPNPEERLLPGMTATLEIVTAEAEDVLTVPSGAVQFRPSAPAAGRRMPPHADDGNAPPPPDGNGGNEGNAGVWVADADGGAMAPRRITVGISDGLNIQVVSGLNEGDKVVTGYGNAATGANDEDGDDGSFSNPFMPKPPERGSGGGPKGGMPGGPPH